MCSHERNDKWNEIILLMFVKCNLERRIEEMILTLVGQVKDARKFSVAHMYDNGLNCS